MLALWPAFRTQRMALDILPALWPAFARATDVPGARGGVDAHRAAEEFADTTRSRHGY